jgi:hypothetical protein
VKTSLSITGVGAVSPAGWGVGPMSEALASGNLPPPSVIERPRGDSNVRTCLRRVPADAAASPRNARLRRASPIAKFAAAAVNEAIGQERLRQHAAGALRIGVIFTVMNGSVNYSNRFFGEVMGDPLLASPILFPETVFNAPSSHLSAMLGSVAPNDTLLGDGTCFLSGIDLAAEWLERGDVDGCAVVAAEEVDWLSAEALGLYSATCLAAEGAGAIYLEPGEGGAQLLKLPDPVPYSAMSRCEAARTIRSRLGVAGNPRTLLVDGLCGDPRIDLAEREAWSDWRGPRISPRTILGEGMGVSTAWQVVAAVLALPGQAKQAVISAVGGNQQASGMWIGEP